MQFSAKITCSITNPRWGNGCCDKCGEHKDNLYECEYKLEGWGKYDEEKDSWDGLAPSLLFICNECFKELEKENK